MHALPAVKKQYENHEGCECKLVGLFSPVVAILHTLMAQLYGILNDRRIERGWQDNELSSLKNNARGS